MFLDVQGMAVVVLYCLFDRNDYCDTFLIRSLAWLLMPWSHPQSIILTCFNGAALESIMETEVGAKYSST